MVHEPERELKKKTKNCYAVLAIAQIWKRLGFSPVFIFLFPPLMLGHIIPTLLERRLYSPDGLADGCDHVIKVMLSGWEQRFAST